MYSLTEDINEDEFKELMIMCIANSTHFSLSDHSYGSELQTNIEALNRSKIKNVKAYKWFGYRGSGWFPAGYEFPKLPSGVSPVGNPMSFDIHEISHESLDVILQLFRNVCTSAEGNRDYEDLCFFNNGSLVFGTVTHENICCYAPRGSSLDDRVLAIGEWEFGRGVYTIKLDEDFIPQ